MRLWEALLHALPRRSVATGGVSVLLLLTSLVGAHEGLRLTAYTDPLGIPTICYGHTATAKLGQVLTREDCDLLLQQDLATALAIVKKAVPYALPRESLAAFTSFTFNVGPGRAGRKDGFLVLKSGRKPRMLQLLEAGDVRGACEELPKWNKQKLPGITKRRAEERTLCLAGL